MRSPLRRTVRAAASTGVSEAKATGAATPIAARPRSRNGTSGSAQLQVALPDSASPTGATRLLTPPAPASQSLDRARPRVSGKFLTHGYEKLYAKGVTYGTFRPGDDGDQYPPAAIVESDFAQMAANGINAVRVYTVPPRWLLDVAAEHGIWVMVGVPWEHHVAFLRERKRRRSIEDRVRAGVAACAEHPAVLAYAIGNEIPSAIVRWHGRRAIERYFQRLYQAAKEEDPGGLVTYVNYPPTEYLQLPFLDLVCFNVYLERQSSLEGYLARLHNLAGDRPVIMSEVGLDSRRHGEEKQADVLDWQVRTVMASGCAGVFLFGWTDEWYRGGAEIDDWDFGLTDRSRRPKPALAAVRRAFDETPFSPAPPWPRVSVVVCSYNGERTLGDCLGGVQQLEYPDFEVIVVDDGSTDRTASIAQEFGARVITTENRGLSEARNTGMRAASGEIVAYLDDDARPDPHWLAYLANAFDGTEFAAVGGPNLPPPGDGLIADCVASAPGGPTHVLLSDTEAEHIPGCNTAFRREYLVAMGGFDPRFRVAGDDVDICWRLQARGLRVGFSPAAVVWHHRRTSLRAYWRQQRGYGKAEALLERKWPEKYNTGGHLRWAGRVYGRGVAARLGRPRIYYGMWGSALFQSLYAPSASVASSLPLMPEWYLVVLVIALLAAGAVLWTPLVVFLPVLAVAGGASVIQAATSAARASAARSWPPALRFRIEGLTALLYLLQPIARLSGRVGNGLTPWRKSCAGLAPPIPRAFSLWNEQWQDPFERLRAIENAVHAGGAPVVRGGSSDRWDLEVRGGMLGAARMRLVVEEHGAGRQLARIRIWPRPSAAGGIVTFLLVSLVLAAATDPAWTIVVLLGAVTLLLVAVVLRDCAAATAALLHSTAPPRAVRWRLGRGWQTARRKGR